MTNLRFAKRSAAIGAAFGAGWLIYMIAMMMTVYDGGLSLIFQPIMGALCSALFVLLALAAGLALRIPPIRRGWSADPRIAGALVLLGLGVLLFGSRAGFMAAGVIDPADMIIQRELRPAAGLTAYFAILFAVANWPVKESSRV
jgi:hypothetical protein